MIQVITRMKVLSDFKHHRKVEHRDGSVSRKVAPLRKTIFSLVDLRKLLLSSSRRYLEFISALDDPTNGLQDLDRVSRPVRKNGRSFRGFNLFSDVDIDLSRAITNGGTNVSDFRSRDLQNRLSMTGWQVTALLRRLCQHSLIKKIGCTFKYYLTTFGRRVTATGLKLREMALIHLLRGMQPTTV